MFEKLTTNLRCPRRPKSRAAFIRLLLVMTVFLQAITAHAGAPMRAKEITGKVTDEKGAPLPNVSVNEKGTSVATQTGTDGTFKISVAGESAVLIFTSVGFGTREIRVGSKSSIDVVLTANAVALNDVVVVGYGTRKRTDVTGAISSISEKALREVPVTNAQQLLQGRVAGVYVTQNSNRPGAEPSVLLRGHRSITAGNDPLYVIDGIPTNDGFNDINPNDIVSMDVLKDASATAIYGSRGANGVIIITTARGKQTANGQPEVRYNTYVGKTVINRYINNLTGPQYVEFRREANRSINNYNDADPVASDAKIFSALELDAISKNQYTDWQREITQNGFQQNHELSILGASATTKYNVSLGYYQDDGYIKLQDFTRYSLRINLDQKITSKINMGVSMLGSFSERNGANFNPIAATVVINPIGSPYGPDGKLLSNPTNDPLMYNPLSDFIPGNVLRKEKRTRLLASLYAEAELVRNLKFRVNFGPDLTNSRFGSFNASNSIARQGQLPNASMSNEYIFSYTLENILDYNQTFGKHKIGATALYSVQERVRETGAAAGENLPVESVTFHNLGSAGLLASIGSSYSRFDILSYMGRINYGFDNRFLFTATVRADGSSVFAPGNKWGFFPSAAFAWNISNEEFMANQNVLSNLKFRLGYGRTGNTALDPYGTLSTLNRSYYDFNDVAALGYYPASIPNPNLKWETTEAFNVGVDFGLLNNRLTGAIEGYRSRTFDLLLPYVLPNSTGFSSVITNVGSTQNTGVELTLSSQNIAGKDFQWTTDFTTAYNQEKILELSLGKVDDIGNARFIGKFLQVYYDYQKVGIWQKGETQAAQYSSSIGQIKVADRNTNGKIDPDDRMIIGSPTPKWTFGFNNRFNYKSFDIGIFAVAVSGNTIVSAFHNPPNNSIAFGGRYNVVSSDYWIPNNPTNAYPRPISGTSGSPGVVFGSTLKYFDGSFIRIRNINFGYNLPKQLISKVKAQSLRVYFNITNPYIFSNYVRRHDGTDPEITDAPSTVNYMLGLNVKF
ncbi:MAG: TonB-dependent receptor [Niastella sp.]|nr:TonB-dependent receptor [Niastella sp.]